MEVRGCGGASRQRAGGRGGGLEATRHRVSGTCVLRFAQYGGGSRAYGVYGVGACWLLVHTSVAYLTRTGGLPAVRYRKVSFPLENA